MNEKSFKDLYEEEKKKPTAAQSFITRIATITKRKEQTVRMWLMGTQAPDDLAKSIIAKELGVKIECLFPQN